MHQWPFCSATTSRRRRYKVTRHRKCKCKCKATSLGNCIDVVADTERRHSATTSVALHLRRRLRRCRATPLCIYINVDAIAKRWKSHQCRCRAALSPLDNGNDADADAEAEALLPLTATLLIHNSHSQLSTMPPSATTDVIHHRQLEC